MIEARDLVPASAADSPEPEPIPAAPVVRGLGFAGLTIATLFLGGGLAWSALAPLESAAIAPGAVKVENNRKTVQHLEGGIIREIMVREGDLVRERQLLLRLDDRDAEADRASLRGQIDAFAAREARLVAQRDGAAEVIYPRALSERRSEPELKTILSGQTQIFKDQKRNTEGEIDVLQRRVNQYQAQIEALKAQVRVTRQQLPNLEEELRDVRTLFSKGLGLKPRVLDLERRVMAAKGDALTGESKIESLKEQAREAEAQIESVRRKTARDISEELREVQTKLAELRESYAKADARAGRRDVLAPHEGVVMNLKFSTAGGVVPPGGAILDLVPREEKLIMEVKISPLDIDVVRPDLPAKVRLVAYKRRTTPVIDGRVSRVSPDATLDEKSGVAYFTAVVEVSAEELRRVANLSLYPGMPVETSIVTGERRMLDYLIQPLTDSLARAFRED